MPKTNAELARELAKLSSDCSFLLTHLVRQNDGRKDSESRKILGKILDIGATVPKPKLLASKVGWYCNINPHIFDPATGKFDGSGSCESVCFTDSTLAGLKAHRIVFNSKYGLAFDRDFLFNLGANPCLNIRTSILKAPQAVSGAKAPKAVFNFIPAQLHPYVNIIHEGFDATHEREWRYVGDLKFKYNDVLFIFCPEKDFTSFASIQSAGRPVLFDLAWLDRI